MSVQHAPAPTMPQTSASSTGCRLVTPDGRALPFRGGHLMAEASGGLARVTLRARFHNPYDEPLQVTWQVPLPADAAVSGFAFELPDERVVGEVDRKQAARERFEEALIEGRTAALLEQDRSSLFTQQVGNIPPGATVTCELVLDQMLRWHGPTGGWEWRFPTVVAPRFLGAPGRTPDAGRVTVDVAEAGTDARLTLALTVRDACTGPLSSPSHDLSVASGEGMTASLGAGAALDRDVVARWPVAAHQPGATLQVARAADGSPLSDHAAGLLTIVPPASARAAVPRDLIVLLDTSGSMGGRPLDQAKAVTCALIDSLQDHDQLQLIEFSTRPSSWKRRAVPATAGNRAAATSWVRGLRAGGGTQMKAGIMDALFRLRGEATRQVLLVTDGLIGFEQEIVRSIALGLPRGCVVHTLGIGSGVNRSLLSPAARAGGGLELILGLDDDPTDAARDLVAATEAPQIIDLQVEGDAVVSVARHRAPDLLAGRPVRLAVQLRPEGGSLELRGHTPDGPWRQTLTVAPTQPGHGDAAIVTLLGREQVEDLEVTGARGEAVDTQIEELGLLHQIATRLTSWVAVSQTATVDPTKPTRAERVAQALPHGMSAEGVGLRAARGGASAVFGQSLAMPAGAPPMAAAPMSAAPMPSMPRRRVRSAPKKRKGGLLDRMKSAFSGGGAPPAEPSPAARPAPPSAPPMDERVEVVLLADLASDASMDWDDDEAPKAEMPVEREAKEEQPSTRGGGSSAVEDDRSSTPAGPLDLVARLVLAQRGRLVFEVVVGAGGLVWPEADGPVLVRLTDGTELEAELVSTATTGPGEIPAGARIRVTLRCAAFDPGQHTVASAAWTTPDGERVSLTL